MDMLFAIMVEWLPNVNGCLMTAPVYALTVGHSI